MNTRIAPGSIPIILISAMAAMAVGCAGGNRDDGADTGPAMLSPSSQVQRNFFTCKDLVEGQWIRKTSDFSTEDHKIIVVARLDETLLNTRLTFEILSPGNKIIEVENRPYNKVQDVGVYFDPIRLIETGGGPGRYRANILSDSNYIGAVDFYVEDFREQPEDVSDPQLENIEWITPK